MRLFYIGHHAALAKACTAARARLHGLDRGDEVVGGHLKLAGGDVTWGAKAEAVHAEDLAVEAHVLVPEARHARLHGDALGDRLRGHIFLVLVRLLVKDAHTHTQTNINQKKLLYA